MKLALPFVLGALAVTAPLWATTINDGPEARFDMLASRASAAAHVRVLTQSSRMEGTRIVTDSVCEVLSSAFGATEGSTVTLTTLGGYWGNIGQRVDGLERPMPGDELAVLLGSDGYMGGGRQLVGFSLGLYRVVKADSQRDIDAPILGYAVNASVTRSASSAPLTLGEFLARAKQAHAE